MWEFILKEEKLEKVEKLFKGSFDLKRKFYTLKGHLSFCKCKKYSKTKETMHSCSTKLQNQFATKFTIIYQIDYRKIIIRLPKYEKATDPTILKYFSKFFRYFFKYTHNDAKINQENEKRT